MDLLPPSLMEPIPRHITKFVRDYDLSSIAKMLRAPDGRSYAEKVEALNKVRLTTRLLLFLSDFQPPFNRSA